MVVLSSDFYGTSADSLLFYAQKAFALSAKINYIRGEALAMRSKGDYYTLVGDLSEMLSSYQQALTLAERAGDTFLSAKVHRNLGQYYLNGNRTDDALAQFLKAFQLVEHYPDSNFKAYLEVDMAAIYILRDQYDSAMLRYQKAMDLANDPNGYIAAFVRNDMGYTLVLMKQYEKAREYHLVSLDYYKHTSDRLGQMNTLLMLGDACAGLGQTQQAIAYNLQGLALAKTLQNKQSITDASEQLSAWYAKEGDYKSSLQYLKMNKLYADSLSNESTREKEYELETKFAYTRKEDSAKIVRARESLIAEQKIERLKLQAGVAVLVSVLLGILVLVLFYNRKVKQESNRILATKNQEISLQKAAIEDHAERLRLSNRDKDRLFSIIAHDLNGPLGSLKSLLDLLKENELTEEEAADILRHLSVDVNSTSELVQNLLYWARSQLGGIVVKPRVFEMTEVLEEIVHLFTRQASAKGIHLVSDIKGSFPVYADSNMMQVVFRNLVSNALKFCHKGDTITITARRKSATIDEFCVTDTGTGMTADVLAKVRNGESVTTFGTASEKGTGLGLLLCWDFIEKNAGTMHIDSEEGKGSCFCVSLNHGTPLDA
ncbi:ATP-binding protein [Dinghuibacter silviterrae]|nr:tetratricopeptide repeat-containing sensor histidine kinase [Dinghuibacter silviterrae]